MAKSLPFPNSSLVTFYLFLRRKLFKKDYYFSFDFFLQAPSERARLYFLLAWFHAIVQERLRYVPLGWSKRYEFSESDLRVACDTLDTWLDAVAQVRDF